MKTKFKVILYIVALAAVICTLVLMFRNKTLDTTMLPLFFLGLAALVLPIWADSIRDDIENVSIEELSINVNRRIKGIYIAKGSVMYTGAIVGETTLCAHFDRRRDCIKWIELKLKEVKIE